jgi:hypothetical protein
LHACRSTLEDPRRLDHCILKRKNAWVMPPTNSLLNQDPLFVNNSKWDFALQPASPAKAAGIWLPAFITDLNDKPRPNPPSIGCYEVD